MKCQMLQQSAISVMSTPDSQRQQHQVISSQSGNIDKTVVHHQHKFATTQLGSKTHKSGKPRQKRKNKDGKK